MDWTVDYGDGPRPCEIPHAWRQDVDVRWEGPAVYRTTLDIAAQDSWLVFHGVSYAARVLIDGTPVREHCGIWDAWAVPVPVGQREVKVEVVKNGGPAYPVKDVLSGFLPYVFHTFGGIFREVELVISPTDPTEATRAQPAPRIGVEGTKLLIDGEPWFMRGVLSWGWYPDLGHPNPSLDDIREEVRKVKALGFNLVKFCLWLPPHGYFQVLEEEQMWAWVELPLWMPSETMDLEAAFAECERIVRQYRRHDRIVAWTCGCELSEATPHEYRRRLFEMVGDLTGCPLVKDNSGGSEMYGGDLREYGTFYDFHPYCDTMFYPPVLDSLLVGPRKKMPVLLGEFNDYDLYRPLGPLRSEEHLMVDPERPWIHLSYESDRPYWSSSDPRLNDQGVRWQHDLPAVLESDPPFDGESERLLQESSLFKACWIREYVNEAVFAHEDIAGYVVTGLRHTPISTSGVMDLENWPLHGRPLRNLESAVFTIPHRSPPWINGGNRPGWHDQRCVFAGEVTVRLGARSVQGFEGVLEVRFPSKDRHRQTLHVRLEPGVPTEIGTVTFLTDSKFDSLLVVGGPFRHSCPIAVVQPLTEQETSRWRVHDPQGRLKLLSAEEGSGLLTTEWDESAVGFRAQNDPVIAFLTEAGTVAAPFWRECVLWPTAWRADSEPQDIGLTLEHYLGIAPDRVIDPSWLESVLPGAEWLLTRVDTRTYARHPYIAQKGNTVVTTLRPWGGLGCQPYGLANNPAGCELLRVLMRLADKSG